MAFQTQGMPRWPFISMALLGVAAGVALVLGGMGGSRVTDGLFAPARRKVLDGHSIGLLSDPRTRLEEARRLGEVRKAEGVPLLRKFSDDKDPEVRAACVWALGEIGDTEAVPAVRLRVFDKDLEVRRQAAGALAKLYCTVADEALKDCLVDEDPGVRIAAAEGLANVRHDERAAARLMTVLDDRAPAVRLAAVRSFAQMPPAWAAKGLAKALADPDAAVRSAARQAVTKTQEHIIPYLQAALGAARDRGARLEAARLLGKMGDVRAAAALIQFVDGTGRRWAPEPELRAAVIESLAAMGPDVLPVLYDKVIEGECSRSAEEAAAEVCIRLGAPAVETICKSILRWKLFPDPEELKLWVATLGEMGDPAAATALNRALSQDIEGMEQVVAEARRKIEAKSGAKLPAPKPDMDILLAEPSPEAFERIRKGSIPLTPADPQPAGVPDSGVVRIYLPGALAILSRGAGGRSSSDLQLELARRGGKWIEDFHAHAPFFNKRYHEGRLLKHRDGDTTVLTVEVVFHDDAWRKSAYGEYEIQFQPKADGMPGTYRGHCNYEDVSGRAAVVSWEIPDRAPEVKPIASGEYPRMLFRKDDLPKLRQRVRTDLGRRIVRALRARAAGAKTLYAEEVNWVSTWTPGIDASIVHGFLGMVFDDPAQADRSVPLLMERTRIPPYGGEHGERLPEPLSHYPFAVDLNRHYLTDEQWQTVRHNLGVKQIMCSTEWGPVGVMAVGRGVVCVPGSMALALLRAKGPSNLPEPEEPAPFMGIEPAEKIGPHQGVPVNDFESGTMVPEWLMIGPFDEGVGRGHPLATLGDPATVQPEEGTSVPWGRVSFRFLPLPHDALRQIPAQKEEGQFISIPAADMGSRTFLYSLLKVKAVQGYYLGNVYPLGYRFANMWINGRPIQRGTVIALAPGMHRIMVEAEGKYVSPYFRRVNANYARALRMKYDRRMEKWRAAYERNRLTGEVQDMPRILEMCRANTRTGIRTALDGARRGGTLRANGFPMPFIFACWTALGEPLWPDTPMAIAAFPHLMAQGAAYSRFNRPGGMDDRYLCYALALAPEPLKPVLLAEFNERLASGRLDRLAPRDLIAALVTYPFDIKPREAPELAAGVLHHEASGSYDFHNGEALVHAFLKASLPDQPTSSLPRAGGFHISGLGTEWVYPQTRKSEFENLLHVAGSEGEGVGKVLYFTPKPDGSGVVGADMSDVYSRGTDLKVQASRHFAVDYGGTSGARVLVAMVDRVRGGGQKSWRIHTVMDNYRSIGAEGGTFFIRKAARRGGGGHSLTGRFIAPRDVRVTADEENRIRKPGYRRIEGVSDAKDVDFFVVMTLQEGDPPKVTVRGTGLDAVVQVGRQEVRFDGQRLVLKH